MSEAPRFFVGPEDAEINPGNYRRFFHHADEDEEEDDESVSPFFCDIAYSTGLPLIRVRVNECCGFKLRLLFNVQIC